MRWMSWFRRSRPRYRCVVGLEMGGDVCRLAVLTGTSAQPEAVSCAVSLNLPEGWVAHGEILQTVAFGQWLRTHLDAGGYQPEGAYIGLEDACISNHLITLATSLSEDDVAFQLQAEVQSLLPDSAAEVCIDYSLHTGPVEACELRYRVQAAPLVRVEAWLQSAHAAGLTVLAIEPCVDAAYRAQSCSPPLDAGAGADSACDTALGLALRAWHEAGVNFLPHRGIKQQVLRRAWWLGMVVCAIGGAILATGFAMAISSAAQPQHPRRADLGGSARAYDEAQKDHAHAKRVQQRSADQARWLQIRQDVQAQSLQWGRVLSQAPQGVWVARVKQQGERWTVQGEALSSSHAVQLMRQLQALDIWTQTPALSQLQVMPVGSATGMPIWQFRIEADLKGGV